MTATEPQTMTESAVRHKYGSAVGSGRKLVFFVSTNCLAKYATARLLTGENVSVNYTVSEKKRHHTLAHNFTKY